LLTDAIPLRRSTLGGTDYSIGNITEGTVSIPASVLESYNNTVASQEKIIFDLMTENSDLQKELAAKERLANQSLHLPDN
jgi:hypothetical protein